MSLPQAHVLLFGIHTGCNNLRYRAINQAMGRVIRHRHDYGAIILADERFRSEGTRKELSCWLRDFVVPHENFGAATKSLQAFFKVCLCSWFGSSAA